MAANEKRSGRWLSPDPLGGDLTNPRSRHGESSRYGAILNRYAYALNNPAALTDPLMPSFLLLSNLKGKKKNNKV